MRTKKKLKLFSGSGNLLNMLSAKVEKIGRFSKGAPDVDIDLNWYRNKLERARVRIHIHGSKLDDKQFYELKEQISKILKARVHDMTSTFFKGFECAYKEFGIQLEWHIYIDEFLSR